VSYDESRKEYIASGEDQIYIAEIRELERILEGNPELSAYLSQHGVDTDSLGEAVRDSKRRGALYWVLSHYHPKRQSRADKELARRINRLFERTPRMLAESDPICDYLLDIAEHHPDYLDDVEKVLFSPLFLRMRAIWHHQTSSTFFHSLKVSFMAWKKAKRRGLDHIAAAIGGLLHDYDYGYDWHIEVLPPAQNGRCRFFDLHFLTHSFMSARAARRDFPQYVGESFDDKIRNIISSHIPLARLATRWNYMERKPFSPEAKIVRQADIKASLDFFRSPLKNVGIDRSKSILMQ